MKFTIANKTLISLIKTSKLLFKYLNQYLFILSFLSFLTSFYSIIKQNKLYKLLITILKILIIINIIVGTGFIIYFTDNFSPFSLSFYYDILNTYLDFLKNLYNTLINYRIEDLIIEKVKSPDLELKNEIKLGVKQGIKEAFDEILTEVTEKNNQDNTYLLKYLALTGSVIFFGYILFILPGSSISPEELTQFNWINQSLIEFKLSVKDLIVNYFKNPSNPGNPGTPNPFIPSTPILQ